MKIAMNQGINVLNLTDEELFVVVDALEAMKTSETDALYDQLNQVMTFNSFDATYDDEDIPDEEDGFSCADLEISLDCMMWAEGVE